MPVIRVYKMNAISAFTLKISFNRSGAGGLG